jgi:uncharacterized protein (DUF1684 family)
MKAPEEEAHWEITQIRHQKDQFFATSPDTPIPPHERQRFGGLRYFAPDPAYRVEAELVPFTEPEIVELGTTSGRIRQYYRAGEVRFILADQACRLTVFKPVPPPGHEDYVSHTFFLPFRDATSGKETYGAGRYLEIEEEGASAGRLIIDFNLAYSPWCAYNEQYSCVLPPEENRLTVPVYAGERSYHEEPF